MSEVISNYVSTEKRKRVTFHLETTEEQFQRVKLNFLDDLANILNVPVEEIWITGIKRGCLILALSIPENVVNSLEKFWDPISRSPLMKIFQKRYDVFAIRTHGEIETQFSVLTKRVKPSEKTITWLHLSDAHMRTDATAQKFDQDKVTTQFLDMLPGLLDEGGRNLKPDFILFTGDIAFSGKKDEYEVASKFLNDLSDRLAHKPVFFFVPGNHDITWEKINIDEDAVTRAKLKDRYSVTAHLIEEQYETQREQDARRLENYFDFMKVCGHLGQPTHDRIYYYTTIIEQVGLNVGIAGLNSAWRSTRKDSVSGSRDLDKENLLLGEPPLKEALEALRDTDLRIALLHHPPHSELWFKDFDIEMQQEYLPKFDFILRGHEHIAKFFKVNPLGSKTPFFEMASGALYFSANHSNGFNAVRLDMDSGIGTIYLWEYNERYQKWRKNLGPDGAEFDGSIEFPFSIMLRERLGGVRER